MKLNDIVYLYKRSQSDELKYSIRSVTENFPFRKLVIVGDRPENIKPDYFLAVDQIMTKGKNVVNALYRIIEDPNISEDFWLFNDDFFIMKPVKQMTPYYNGELTDLINILYSKFGNNQYVDILKRALYDLVKNGYSIHNYETHTPILLNKDKVKELIKAFNDLSGFRSKYGNYFKIGGRNALDVKVSNNRQPKESSRLLSTSNQSFTDYKVGDLIRETFKNKSRYEQQQNNTL